MILESRGALGGTWDLFRYPGIRSDSDMFTLGYPFEPWRDAKSIADGPSILRYLTETTRKYGIDRRIRYRTKLSGADWSSGTLRWTLTLEQRNRAGAVTRRTLTCGFLYSCAGYYNYDRGHAPDQYCRRRPQSARKLLTGLTTRILGDERLVAEDFTPSYDPWDQRLCAAPNADFFRAMKKNTAEVVTGDIDRFVPEGVRLRSGRVLPADTV